MSTEHNSWSYRQHKQDSRRFVLISPGDSKDYRREIGSVYDETNADFIVKSCNALKRGNQELESYKECHNSVVLAGLKFPNVGSYIEQLEKERDALAAKVAQEKAHDEFYRGKALAYMGAEIEWEEKCDALAAELAQARAKLQYADDVFTRHSYMIGPNPGDELVVNVAKVFDKLAAVTKERDETKAERMEGYNIADEMRDAVWKTPGFTFTGKNYQETIGRIKELVLHEAESKSITLAAVSARGKEGE